MRGPVILAPRTIQFADDTIIITEARVLNLQTIVQVLHNFASISGLKINDSKSLFVPIALDEIQYAGIQLILNCTKASLPITYLGLPLAVKNPRRMHFLPLIEAVQNRLQGWKAKFLSPAGRIILIRATLSALPIHYMQVIKMPKWVDKEIDRLRRNFLWRGKENCSGGHCLISWEKCCLPTKNGGLGLSHLSTHNDALLAKWLWKLRAHPTNMWVQLVLEIYGTNDVNQLANHTRLSPNLKLLLQLTPIVQCSITKGDQRDRIVWRWSPDGSFSAGSLYHRMREPGVI